MEILTFGHKGTPVIIFPSEEGRFHEWEDSGVIEGLEEQINEGYNQIFCVDSVAFESFLNRDVEPNVRLGRHKQYESYIVEEVIPYIRKINSNPYLITAGAYLGAYYSLLLALKYPKEVQKVISMCGSFDIKPYLDGFYDDNVYFNNPFDFLPNLNDQKILKQISKIDIRLLTYANDPQRHSMSQMSDTLWMKNIEHDFYSWDESYSDPWECVAPMLKEHIY